MSYGNKKRGDKIWWTEKRNEYNIGLLLSGILSFILYLLVIEFVVAKSNKINPLDIEITIFTIFFQGIAYLIMMGIANLIYSSLYYLDININSKNDLNYRNNIFKAYFWVSCSFPFLIPLFLFFYYI